MKAKQYVQGFFLVVFAVAGVLLDIHIVILDEPVHSHSLFLDYPNPDRPGHLKGVIVGTPELLAKCLTATVLLGAAWWLYRFLRKFDKELDLAVEDLGIKE